MLWRFRGLLDVFGFSSDEDEELYAVPVVKEATKLEARLDLRRQATSGPCAAQRLSAPRRCRIEGDRRGAHASGTCLRALGRI